MTRTLLFAFLVCSAGGAAALATDPILQLDLNGLAIQARNSVGAATAFGGLSHTGSVDIFFAPGVSSLPGISISPNPGPFVDQGFNGVLSGLTGTISVVNGNVTGGSLLLQVNGATADPDTYAASIVPGVGNVQAYVGGGFTIEGLTFGGHFDDSMFGNVDITPWIAGALNGSFLQFNFSPNASGGGFADIDAFVVAPAPGTLVGLALPGLILARRRRR